MNPLRRFLVLFASTVWWGGLTIYSLVVIHVGIAVLNQGCFDGLHRAYLIATTIQWAAGIVYIVAWTKSNPGGVA